MKFKLMDIVEIVALAGQPYHEWEGLTIEVSSYSASAGLICGKVLKASTPDRGYPVGSRMSWCVPDAFTHVTAKETPKDKNKDKYLSPFSGRWE